MAALTEHALRLINDLATPRSGGRAVPLPDPAEVDPDAIGALVSAYDVGTGHPKKSPPSRADAALLVSTVRELRTAVEACVDGDIAAAARTLNGVLVRHRAIPNLHSHGGRPPVLAFHRVDHSATEARIADMAAGLAMIVGTGRTSRLGRCQAAECDRVFFDATRNGSRRYCDLACQNRAKAAAYRARRAG